MKKIADRSPEQYEDLMIEAVRVARPDGWRGVLPREQTIKEAIYRILPDVTEVERIFLIIKAQQE